jgi:AbrB family looped-hinge helix DNA binding protein
MILEWSTMKQEASDVRYVVRRAAVMKAKGQIVIPADLRKKYRLKEGTTVLFHEERGRIILEPNNFAAIYALQGSLREFPLEASLEEERTGARAHEGCEG